jgi:flagellar biosynthesis GTPase FlhF
MEELVLRIRQELGDDAVIVSPREMTSGAPGGFFTNREIELEVRRGSSAEPRGASARTVGQSGAGTTGRSVSSKTRSTRTPKELTPATPLGTGAGPRRARPPLLAVILALRFRSR